MAVVHIVVVHKKLAAIGGIVEEVCEIAHDAVEVVALADDVVWRLCHSCIIRRC